MIIFTRHSLFKLKQREIPQLVVVKTLKKPDYTFDSYGDRKIAYRKFNHLYLKVVYKTENHNFVVITQHWVKEIK